MQKITLQDIITKKLNNLIDTPDDLICDAYYQIHDAQDEASYVSAYIAARVAIEANKSCGVEVPNLVNIADNVLKKSRMSEQEMADYYLAHE